jgi:hypothetical protein
MNLVAKEYIHSHDDELGVLILSQFTGAARELAESIIEEISVQDCNISIRCKRLAREMFSSKIAVKQISRALSEIS